MLIPILHQDPDLIVVDKPAGIPTHAADPADPYPGDALRVVQAQTGLPYLGMHQRLDAETSGVLLFAARREANAALARAFEGRSVQKTYLALVHGAPPRPAGVIELPIVRDQGERYRVAAASDPHGLAARTRYRVLARGDERRTTTDEGRTTADRRLASDASRMTLLELIPATGRPHQLRVHLAAIGCPVVGDPLYDPRLRPAPRLCLHAYRLALPHPTTGEQITFTAPAPEWGAPSQPPTHIRALADRAPAELRALLHLAVARRAPLAADPQTSIYRLVNAAADGLPGLTVDRYGQTLVVSLYDETLTFPPSPCPASLIAALAEATGGQRVYVKYRPKEAGRIPEAQAEALAPRQPAFGPAQDEMVAHEDGLAYLIRPGVGLSVGLFPDMRETRGRVRAWAGGKRVLNCFAYTCGFGVAAMAGGAARVLNLDLSKPVLEWGKANYRANGLPVDDHDFVFGDVFDWLGRLAKRGDRFDLVILDPPGFSRTKTRRFVAAHDYGELAAQAAQVTATDGLLLACCNVAELPWRAFRERVLAGITAAGRSAAVAGVYHEPALDFPAAMGEANYLKILAVRLGGISAPRSAEPV
jgi:23S rRNA (cytosine1962-C5)-methyltransferase